MSIPSRVGLGHKFGPGIFGLDQPIIISGTQLKKIRKKCTIYHYFRSLSNIQCGKQINTFT